MNKPTLLTILPSDGNISKPEGCFLELDLSSCSIPEDIHAFHWWGDRGIIEFTDTRPNEEVSTLPVWADACSSLWEQKNYEIKNPPPPTPEQLAANNEVQAKFLLMQSDWAVLPDTNLQNQAEWDAYRVALRVIVLNPPQEEIVSWPVKPEAVWA